MALHIVHGDTHGDKRHLQRAAEGSRTAPSWIVPSAAVVGDDAVVYVGSQFFATAKIATATKPRPDWGDRRYGAGLRSIELIEPPISLEIIRAKLPELTWAIYPRSITTVSPSIAKKITKLIGVRRRRGGRDLEDSVLDIADIDELRARALADARPSADRKVRMTGYRPRSLPVHRYVLARADGVCEGCGSDAPFLTGKMTAYLEPHHTVRLADDGPDHPRSVIALCPTCHRRVHHSHDGDKYNARLVLKLKKLEPNAKRARHFSRS